MTVTPTPDVEPSQPTEDPSRPPSVRPNYPEAPADPTNDGDPPPATTDPGANDGAGQKPLSTGQSPAPGEIVISEVMYDPSGLEPEGEWIEVFNTAPSARSLTGLTLVDGAGRSHVIAGPLDVPPSTYVVLARSLAGAAAAKLPAAVVVYEYGKGADDSSGVQLSNNSTGKIAIDSGTTVIAAASYGGWFSAASGRSIQLKTPTQAASALATSWCLSKNPWTTGSDKGTPGKPSDCP